VRCAVYMATLSSIRWNPVIKAMYPRLIARGKPFKVAMIACRRRLPVILNTMARTNTLWNPALEAAAQHSCLRDAPRCGKFVPS
jgi:transposase